MDAREAGLRNEAAGDSTTDDGGGRGAKSRCATILKPACLRHGYTHRHVWNSTLGVCAARTLERAEPLSAVALVRCVYVYCTGMWCCA